VNHGLAPVGKKNDRNMPSYHIRIKDLAATQIDFRVRFSKMHLVLMGRGIVTYEAYREMYAVLAHQHDVELDQLREQHRVAREEAKAAKMLEKMRVGERSKEPAFWIANPNDDGRRDTMMAVLTAAGRNWPTDHVNDMMPAYARWLLTANKTNEAGRPMNRWALMTAFLESFGIKKLIAVESDESALL